MPLLQRGRDAADGSIVRSCLPCAWGHESRSGCSLREVAPTARLSLETQSILCPVQSPPCCLCRICVVYAFYIVRKIDRACAEGDGDSVRGQALFEYKYKTSFRTLSGSERICSYPHFVSHLALVCNPTVLQQGTTVRTYNRTKSVIT